MTQKAYAEGLRALVLYTATYQDALASARLRGETGEAADLAERVNDLLLPIVKGGGSERSWTLLGTETLQTFGGSGFLQDYPIEQYVRDAKIDTLYEGTTAIQGLDFFFRKIVRDKGLALGHISAQVQDFVKGGTGSRRRAGPRARAARPGAGGRAGHRRLHGRRPAGVRSRAAAATSTNIYKVGQNTTRLLLACTDLLVGWLLLRQAEVATAALARDGVVGQGPRRSTRARSPRPGSSPRRCCPRSPPSAPTAEATDNALMDLDESAF